MNTFKFKSIFELQKPMPTASQCVPIPQRRKKPAWIDRNASHWLFCVNVNRFYDLISLFEWVSFSASIHWLLYTLNSSPLWFKQLIWIDILWTSSNTHLDIIFFCFLKQKVHRIGSLWICHEWVFIQNANDERYSLLLCRIANHSYCVCYMDLTKVGFLLFSSKIVCISLWNELWITRVLNAYLLISLHIVHKLSDSHLYATCYLAIIFLIVDNDNIFSLCCAYCLRLPQQNCCQP